MKWEYKVIIKQEPTDLENTLKKLGLDEWELVTCLMNGDFHHFCNVVLKRPVK